MKEIAIKIAVALLMLATLVGRVVGCTPAAQQLGAELGVDIGELACLKVAQCNGIVDSGDLAAFCRVAHDRVERYLAAQADPACPLPDAGGDAR